MIANRQTRDGNRKPAGRLAPFELPFVLRCALIDLEFDFDIYCLLCHLPRVLFLGEQDTDIHSLGLGCGVPHVDGYLSLFNHSGSVSGSNAHLGLMLLDRTGLYFESSSTYTLWSVVAWSLSVGQSIIRCGRIQWGYPAWAGQIEGSGLVAVLTVMGR